LKLCICDIDGVIADSTKRFLAATVDGKIVWEKALSSELLHLDTLIPNAAEDLRLISERYDKTILLTSRYDHMRSASLIWLDQHDIVTYERAIFKPYETKRFTKTKVWKADEVLRLLHEYSAPPHFPVTDLLIIEDEEANQETIQQEAARWIMAHREVRARYYVSLHDAREAIEAGVLERRPPTELASGESLYSLDDQPF
jgi:hypothetical protein